MQSWFQIQISELFGFQKDLIQSFEFQVQALHRFNSYFVILKIIYSPVQLCLEYSVDHITEEHI